MRTKTWDKSCERRVTGRRDSKEVELWDEGFWKGICKKKRDKKNKSGKKVVGTKISRSRAVGGRALRRRVAGRRVVERSPCKKRLMEIRAAQERKNLWGKDGGKKSYEKQSCEKVSKEERRWIEKS